MNELRKRKLWRPRYADGTVVRGGAGGFHLPQKPERRSYLNTARRKRSTQRKRRAS